VEYGQPYGFSCSRSVPIHFKPLLGIVTRKDFYFLFFMQARAKNNKNNSTTKQQK
jgi:hypothetical protein